MLALFFYVEFLLHIPCFLFFFLGFFVFFVCLFVLNLGSFFYYTYRVGFISFFFFFFCLESFSKTSRAGFISMRIVSLTHPVLILFLCGEFLFHILCCLDFYARSLSYTSHAGFFIFLFI